MSARSVVAMVWLAAAVACGARSPDGAPPPRQPMPFSHRVHVREAGIGCSSCHAYASHSPVAGMPSVERCRGCHKFVKQDPERPKMTEEMKPLLAWLKQHPRDPIPWARVHRLPDHVHFDHAPHVRASVRCEECHGPVDSMDEARQVSPLTMGWCLDCHRRRQAERPAERTHLTDCLGCHR